MAAAEPGYEERTIEGLHLLVEHSLASQSPDLLAETLDVLRGQLQAIVRGVPDPALGTIREVPIWIHRQSGTPCMAFHPSAKWLGEHGFNPKMANAIEIGNVMHFLAWTGDQPWMVLHELAHAYQFRTPGFDNQEVKRCWEAARGSGKYDQVLHISGKTQRHYALENPNEYFAELSESYFGTNDFYPFVRAELQKYDAEGYALIRQMWKVPDK